MVNLFRLLGLPDPAKPAEQILRGPRTADPGPQNNDSFHDLGKEIWSERTHKLIDEPERYVHYIKPDDLQKIRNEVYTENPFEVSGHLQYLMDNRPTNEGSN